MKTLKTYIIERLKLDYSSKIFFISKKIISIIKSFKKSSFSNVSEVHSDEWPNLEKGKTYLFTNISNYIVFCISDFLDNIELHSPNNKLYSLWLRNGEEHVMDFCQPEKGLIKITEIKTFEINDRNFKTLIDLVITVAENMLKEENKEKRNRMFTEFSVENNDLVEKIFDYKK